MVLCITTTKVFYYTFMISKDERVWCCKIVDDYPDLTPFVSWGSLGDEQIRAAWNQKDCNTEVGGKNKNNCKGI